VQILLLHKKEAPGLGLEMPLLELKSCTLAAPTDREDDVQRGSIDKCLLSREKKLIRGTFKAFI